VAVREALLAVAQENLGKHSIGYHEILFWGDVAERQTDTLRIGSKVAIQGSLWSRKYRNRKGNEVTEIKVMVSHWEMVKGSERTQRHQTQAEV
jgi:single-stranded DNA-binding protein